MFDPNSEDYSPLSLLAREIPNRTGGFGVNSCTIWRWAMRGINGVKLRTILVGGIRMSCGAWLAEFFAATTAAAEGAPIPATLSKTRQKRIDAAEQKFAEMSAR